MNLSSHFDLASMELSQEATRRGIDNTAPPYAIENLRRLCVEVLEPLRKSIGVPIYVSSGYRCPTLNGAVGGDAKSDHMTGSAADIVAPPFTVDQVAFAARNLATSTPIKQVIVEFGRWVHISVRQTGSMLAPEFLVATHGDDGKVHYSEA